MLSRVVLLHHERRRTASKIIGDRWYLQVIYRLQTYMMDKSKRTRDDAPVIPLTPAVFFILLALSDGEKHGYAIMRLVGEQSGQKVRMGPGTLYTTIQRLLELGLIEEVRGPGPTSERDSRRRFYRLTGDGQDTLQAELSRIDDLVRLARRKKLIPRTE